MTLNNYFADCNTPEEIKAEYRRLAMENHPDRGGDTRTMQDINAAYHTALGGKHEFVSTGSDGKTHTYYYNADVEQELMDKIAELFKLDLTGVNVYLVGTWLWIDGNTRPIKDDLKAVGCRWHGKRAKWYYRRYTGKRQWSAGSFEDICSAYGYQKLAKDERSEVSGKLA